MRNIIINYDFHPFSGMDYSGRLFWHEGNLYRGINPGRESFYKKILNAGIVQAMVDRKLIIDTSDAGWSTTEFPLVLKHRVIPTISFPAEWCFSQLKDAALLALDLELALRSRNLTLWNASPWNILFDTVHPYWVDFCAIEPLENVNSWRAREQFRDYFYNPLRLFDIGLSRVARRLMFDPWVGVPSQEMELITGGKTIYFAKRAAGALKRITKAALPPSAVAWGRLAVQGHRARFHGGVTGEILTLRDTVIRMRGPEQRSIYSDSFPEFRTSADWTSKHHSGLRILQTKEPKTVLDVGSNRGWFSRLAGLHGVRVIAADSDETALNELYADAKEKRLPILPVFMRVRSPEPAQGPAYKMIASAAQRFRSDMVMAFGLVHYLVFKENLTFAQIIDGLGIFARKWLVVEFIGPEDSIVRDSLGRHRTYPWYTLDGFLTSLDRWFEVVDRLPSDWGGPPNSGKPGTRSERIILVCRKRSLPVDT
jgi:hypothetical protein